MRVTLAIPAFLLACGVPTGVAPPGDPSDTPAEACAGLEAGTEGAFLARDAVITGWRPECEGVAHATAGARASTLEVRLVDWDAGPARVVVTDLLGDPLADDILDEGGSVEVTLPRSGEVLVALAPKDPDEPANAYALSVSCVAGCDAEYTRYPVVLLHGAAPDDYYGLVDYFHGVHGDLEGLGFHVETPAVDPFASTEARAAQWTKHLDDLVADGVGRRFNLVAHSQGGLDARFLVSRLGQADRVASVVTIATPHRGSAVADVAAGLIDLSPVADDLVDAAADGLAALLGLPPQDALGAVATLNTAAMAEFNAQTPDAPCVYYASWAGHSCGILEPSCIAEQGGEVVTPFLGATYTLLWLTDGPNDGMVPVASAVWGDFRGEIPADHLDEVGQIVGLTSPAFDHEAFYRDEARRLAARGL